MVVEEQVANTLQRKACDLVKRKKLIPEGLFCFVKLKHTQKTRRAESGLFPRRLRQTAVAKIVPEV